MENYDNKDFAGRNGFIWWVGVIEDRQDPLKMGRCRVRCIGWHAEDKMRLPTDMLPWATPSLPINNPSPYAPREGDMVFGFFADGEDAQYPMIIGIVPGIPQQPANSSKGFNDPRTPAKLAERPRPPSEIIKSQTTAK
jgi:hypothetical protein